MLSRLLPSRRSASQAGETGLTVAGLDLGERRTKVVVFTAEAGNVRLIGTEDQPTPTGIFFNGRPGRPLEAAQWIRRLLMPITSRVDQIAIAVPAAEVQVRRLPVPNPDDRAAVLRALAASPAFRSADGSQWHYDYQSLRSAPGQVTAVAARMDAIRAVQACVRAAGMKPGPVSVLEVALANAYLAQPDAPTEPVFLLEAGFNGSTLVLVENGELLHARRILSGAREIAERLGATALPAEMPEAAAHQWAEKMAQEVRMIAGAVFGSMDIPPIRVAGGLASYGQLLARLADVLAADVAPFGGFDAHPWAAGSKAKLGAPLAVAWGLAAQALPREAGLSMNPTPSEVAA